MRNDIDIVLDKDYRRGVASLQRFADIFSQIEMNKDKKIVIDLTEYRFIHPCFAVLVAAMPYVGDKTVIRYRRDHEKCVKFLRLSGIHSHFTSGSDVQVFDRKRQSLEFQLVDNLEKSLKVSRQIIETFPVKLEENAQDELISIVYEVFSNAFYHSKEKVAFCCGFYDNQGALNFSIYDYGIGIPKSVKSFLKTDISNKDALKWAWKQGHSSLNGHDDYPRGEGFHTLEEFVVKNDGEILVGSGQSYCIINAKKKSFGELKSTITGTFFSLRIKKDYLHKYKKDKSQHIIKEDI